MGVHVGLVGPVAFARMPWIAGSESSEGWVYFVSFFAMGFSVLTFLRRYRRATRTPGFQGRQFVMTWSGSEPILIFLLFSLFLGLPLAF